MSIKIVTDSTSDIPLQLQKEVYVFVNGVNSKCEFMKVSQF